MPRKPSATLTDAELRIMEAVWELGEGSVRDVADRVNQQENLAYNTVQTMLRILEDKGYLTHRQDGRAFVYQPAVDRTTARTSALRHLMRRFFDDSPRALVQNLLNDDELDAAEIERLRSMIRNAEDNRR